MNLNKEQLEALEDFAYNLIPISIMAIMMEMDELDLRTAIDKVGTPERKAYYKGYGRILLELRKNIIRAAQNGSNPAQTELLKFLREFQNDRESL